MNHTALQGVLPVSAKMCSKSYSYRSRCLHSQQRSVLCKMAYSINGPEYEIGCVNSLYIFVELDALKYSLLGE